MLNLRVKLACSFKIQKVTEFLHRNSIFIGKLKNSKLLAIYKMGHNWTVSIKFGNN